MRTQVFSEIAFAMILGVLLMVTGMVIAMPVLKLSGTPETVLPQTLLYIYIYFAGMILFLPDL